MRHFLCFAFFITTLFDAFGQHNPQIDSFIKSIDAREKEIGELLRKEGNQFLMSGDYNQASAYYKQALTLFLRYEDSLGVGNTYNSMGYLATRKGQAEKGIELYYKALQVFKAIDDPLGQIKVNTNLAGLFYGQRDYKGAITCYYRTEQLLQKYHDPNREANVALGLGNILSAKEYEGYDEEKAMDAYSKALNIYLEFNDQRGLSMSYNNIARLFSNQDKLDAALSNYSKALKIYKSIQDRKGETIANLNIGVILKKQKKLDESLNYFKQGEAIALEIGDASNYLHILSNLVDVTAALNMVDSMTYYLSKYKSLKDSLFNEEKQRQISELQTLYETEQKEQALAEEQELNKSKTMQNRVLFFLAIALLVAIVLILIINKKRRVGLKRNAQKEREIAALNAQIVGQERERERIARDLHDRIGAMLNNVKMMHAQYAPEGGELGAKVEEGLTLTSNTVREVSHNLASATLKRHGLIAATGQLFDNLNATGKLEARLITKGLEERLPEGLERVIDFCVHELVNNTIKHAQATRIDLQYLVNNGVLHLSYEDDGRGFDAKLAEYGIGLKSIEARVASIHGKLHVESRPGDGILVNVEIPIR